MHVAHGINSIDKMGASSSVVSKTNFLPFIEIFTTGLKVNGVFFVYTDALCLDSACKMEKRNGES